MTSWREEYVSPDASSGFERTLGDVWVPRRTIGEILNAWARPAKTLFQFPKFLKATNKSSTDFGKETKGI
jgi:hypothetical protein